MCIHAFIHIGNQTVYIFACILLHVDVFFAAKESIAHRQKLIRLADSSELGWRLVNEYESNPLASDSDDERKMYKAEARASRKLKAEKAKKSRGARAWPYRKSAVPATTVQSTEPQQAVRRPGLCFACGKPGHWKGAPECSAKHSNNKISKFVKITGQSVIDVNVDCSTDIDSVRNNDSNHISADDLNVSEIVSPVGRLRGNLSKWKDSTDSVYICDVIEFGYRLPLKEVPDNVVLKNNRSARDNPDFVKKEIKKLLFKRIVSKCNTVPHIVNPLTVAYNRTGKPRLVLDCRHINPHLHQFKVKFEDIKIAESLFDRHSFLLTYDLKGEYHHIDIFPDHRTYLGFSFSEDGQIGYYVFNSLPFGIKTAGHIFTKVLKVVVTCLRAQGHKIIMFLDDGIGGHTDYNEAVRSSEHTKQTILSFVFLLANVIGFLHVK